MLSTVRRRCAVYLFTVVFALAAVAILELFHHVATTPAVRLVSLVMITSTISALIIGALRRARIDAIASRREIARAAERFAQLFHASPVAMTLSRMDDATVVETNEAHLSLFGITRSGIIGRTPLSAGIDARESEREEAFAELRAKRRLHREITVDSPTGPHNVMLWSRIIEIDGVDHALSTFVDFTERKQAETAAREAADRLREFAESVEEVFWISDTNNTKMLYISPNYERMFGRSCDELYRDSRSWLLAVHPDDRERMTKVATPPWTDTYRIVRPDRSVRTIRIQMFPIKDAAGNAVRQAGIAHDVTDQLVLEEQLRQTQKLESLGLLAGGIAHDFNNVLAVIAANSNLLTETITPDHPDRELVAEIDAAVTRATSLTRQLLAFSRKQVVEPVVIDLNSAVSDTRKMLRRMVGEDIVIATSLEPDLAHVRIDPGHLVQVIMNLTVNARDAMPRGGTLALATRAIRGEVMLSITDTGCGMTADVKARAFEPFFTTKGVGKGTGLGLSVVHGIVQTAGGRIEIESAVGAGTSFRIYLPKVDAPVELAESVAVAGAGGIEKIVLVDDDLFVRASTSRALRARGYNVLEAADGHHALRLLHDHGHDVDLLVTDVVMPGMDGRELVEAARARRPSLKVLYISGYTDDAVIRHGVQHAEVNIIEKPFAGHSLATRVRQILDAA
jgi:two-component system, cell cycle sensor histidine kinase and response regulator CckA